MSGTSKKAVYLTEFARFILTTTFLFSAFVKAIDPEGTAIKISEYLYALDLGSIASWNMFIGMAIILCEFLLGSLLLLGLRKKFTTVATLVFMSFMTLLTLYSLIYNPVHDCGCFGDAIKLTNLQTFLKNIVLLALSIPLFRFHKTLKPAYKKADRLYILLAFGVLGFVFFIWQNLVHLPMIDFRPFKVEKKLADLVLVPDGAPQDVYTYEFIYEKNGVKKSFSIDNLPDNSWTFVERKETIEEVGYRPPVSDFVLLDGTRDVTREIIDNTSSEMIWIISPDWAKASKKTVPYLNNLYATAQKNGIRLFGVSGSSITTTGRWINATHAMYPTLLLDATTCKTIVRGNPSIMFIKGGKIHAKINAKDLIGKEDIDEFVNNILSNSPHHEPYLLRVLPLVIWLLIVLVCFLKPQETRKFIQ